MRLKIKIAAAIVASVIFVVTNFMFAGGGGGLFREAGGEILPGAEMPVVWVGGNTALSFRTFTHKDTDEKESGRKAVFANKEIGESNPPPTTFVESQDSGIENGIKGMVSINFDDGWLSAYENGVPIVETAGFVSTHFIITGAVGWKNYMTWEQIADLAARGHEIGSHTQTHADLKAATGPGLESETAGSAMDLAARGFHPSSFSYPYGHVDEDAIAAVQSAGFTNGRATVTEGRFFNNKNTNRYTLRSRTVDGGTTLSEIREDIDTAVEDDSWYILVFHGIGDGRDTYSVSEQFLRDVVAYIKQTGIPVVTSREGIGKL